MKTEFLRSLNCNYKRILLEEKPEERKYQYCILNRGGIGGLLPCSLRYIDGEAYLYYDITSRQNIRQMFERKVIPREWVCAFLKSFQQLRQELDRFLLDMNHVLWYPDEVFQELDANKFSFLYVPYYEGDNGFKALLDFWVERIDYNDDELVECVYHMFEQFDHNGEVYLQEQIFQDALRLEKPMQSERQPVVLEEERLLPDLPPQEEDTEQKKSLFGLFDSRKRKSKEKRELYRSEMRERMEGYSVAEQPLFEEKYGRTLYIEETLSPEKDALKLCTAEGKQLKVLGEDAIIIGKKKEEADIVVEDASISRLHAKIFYENKAYYLEDLNSTNGTFKNGLRLKPYERRQLEPGDEIKLGRILLLFQK
ncbi:MAG: FHA domain-containing protein [Acetatifactor sp.]|nr:FHA domain-containing protein [Acetatifactor sp.]